MKERSGDAKVREQPIIMSGNHPKLIIDGLKTMTRRVIKPQPFSHSGHWWNCGKKIGTIANIDLLKIMPLYCPYGQVGDRLWVRETTWRGQPTATAIYDADLPESERADYWDKGWRKFPSIFLPKVYSRITLEITEVRVERVQEITSYDCVMEGISYSKEDASVGQQAIVLDKKFRKLWDSLNAKRGYGWDKNPWVWCLSFKVV